MGAIYLAVTVAIFFNLVLRQIDTTSYAAAEPNLVGGE
jgi:hypothetical protein